jgi:hypothetical protein
MHITLGKQDVRICNQALVVYQLMRDTPLFVSWSNKQECDYANLFWSWLLLQSLLFLVLIMAPVSFLWRVILRLNLNCQYHCFSFLIQVQELRVNTLELCNLLCWVHAYLYCCLLKLSALLPIDFTMHESEHELPVTRSWLCQHFWLSAVTKVMAMLRLCSLNSDCDTHAHACTHAICICPDCIVTHWKTTGCFLRHSFFACTGQSASTDVRHFSFTHISFMIQLAEVDWAFSLSMCNCSMTAVFQTWFRFHVWGLAIETLVLKGHLFLDN